MVDQIFEQLIVAVLLHNTLRLQNLDCVSNFFFLCYMVIFACCASDCIGIEYLGWTGWVLDYLVVAVTLCSALRLTEYWLCEEDFFCYMVILACCAGDGIHIKYRGWSGWVPEYLMVTVFIFLYKENAFHTLSNKSVLSFHRNIILWIRLITNKNRLDLVSDRLFSGF